MTLPDDVRDWAIAAPDALEAYRERAAIVEVDGCRSHREALRVAEERVRIEWARLPERGEVQ